MTTLIDKPVKLLRIGRERYINLDDLIAHFTVEIINTTPDNDIRISEYLRDVLEDLIRFKEKKL